MSDEREPRLAAVYRYHQQTKHRLDRYAAGPETLDWDHQPDPFRRFAGADLIPLPLIADELETPWSRLFGQPLPAQAPSLSTLGGLFELSLALAAWKSYGPSSWALRCNPSSGNLHPTEGYLIAEGVADLPDGVYHYAPKEHALERRCTFASQGATTDLYLALSSVAWREAWKYGERAFRYVQLDIGHALGALRYAAALFGWRLERVPCSDPQLATLLGLSRHADFDGAERELPDLLLRIDTAGHPGATDLVRLGEHAESGEWQGRANGLGGQPRLDWPVIDEVAAACEWDSTPEPPPVEDSTGATPIASECPVPAATLIRTRRSAQAYDGSTLLPFDAFVRMLDALLPQSGQLPWDLWPDEPRIHPLLFVHRVADVRAGLYALPRRPGMAEVMQQAMTDKFLWEPVDGMPTGFPLRRLIVADGQKVARTLSCHQPIASHGCFTLGMLAEFDRTLEDGPQQYRRLYWEAGLVGQVLYLEAEAAGVRGTGIGCFFDDAFHQMLGLEDTALQSLYHFTIGGPVTDTRIQSDPPYPAGREAAG